MPFFGVRASTSAGVATLAIRSGAPVVPVYALREAPDRHRIVVIPALETPQTGDRRRDARAATRLYNAVFESIIRRHPEHWMWGHRRFRHSPDLPGDPYAG